MLTAHQVLPERAGIRAPFPSGHPLGSSRSVAAVPPTKLSQLKAAAAAGDWPGALRIAARFPNLGAHRDAILRAHNALLRPDFYRQIGRDPDAAVAAGIAALRARYQLAA